MATITGLTITLTTDEQTTWGRLPLAFWQDELTAAIARQGVRLDAADRLLFEAKFNALTPARQAAIRAEIAAVVL